MVKVKRVTSALLALVIMLSALGIGISTGQAKAKDSEHVIGLSLTDGLKAEAKSHSFKQGENVLFGVRNNSNYSLGILNNSWRILDGEGKEVYNALNYYCFPSGEYYCMGTVIEMALIRPKDSVQWSWSQINSEGKPVTPGKYTIEFTNLDARIDITIH